jgi:hypothetical protein
MLATAQAEPASETAAVPLAGAPVLLTWRDGTAVTSERSTESAAPEGTEADGTDAGDTEKWLND